MPRNKIQQNSEEKRTEIVAAARALFLEAGYETTSMASIAAAAGVASNTIYWYFRDKDELLVAVLDAELDRGMAEFLDAPDTDFTGRVLGVVRQLERAHRLVATVHARVPISPVISAWHDRFHGMTEMLILLEMYQAGVSTKSAKALAKIWVFTVEGLLAHPTSDDDKRQICASLAKSLMVQ